MRRFEIIFLILMTIAVSACLQSRKVSPRPILIQGALSLETSRLVGKLKDVKIEDVGVWRFWRGTIDGYPVVVSKTRMGSANAAAVTALAIECYHPIAIINEGTAGGHDPGLHVYDIVLGVSAVNIGAFKTPYRAAGKGTNTLNWVSINLMETKGSAEDDLHEHKVASFGGDPLMLTAARHAKSLYTRGRLIEGVIGSSDIWNEEIDRIAWFRKSYSTSVEEMETAPAAQIADLFHVPFLGIRIVSANITSGGDYDPKTGEACQDYVYNMTRAFLANLKY